MTVTRVTETGEHSLTVPDHRALRVGTLRNIVNAVAADVGLSSQAVKEALFTCPRDPPWGCCPQCGADAKPRPPGPAPTACRSPASAHVQ